MTPTDTTDIRTSEIRPTDTPSMSVALTGSKAFVTGIGAEVTPRALNVTSEVPSTATSLPATDTTATLYKSGGVSQAVSNKSGRAYILGADSSTSQSAAPPPSEPLTQRQGLPSMESESYTPLCEDAARDLALSSPSGDVGMGRDARGRFAPGNTLSRVTGSRSVAYWNDVEALRRERIAEVLRDCGQGEDASYALRTAADGLVQAALIRDAAWDRIVAIKGPLTEADRERSAFKVWQSAQDRAERYLRLLGLERKPRKVETLQSHVAATYGGTR
jgi:hypothetical protein